MRLLRNVNTVKNFCDTRKRIKKATPRILTPNEQSKRIRVFLNGDQQFEGINTSKRCYPLILSLSLICIQKPPVGSLPVTSINYSSQVP